MMSKKIKNLGAKKLSDGHPAGEQHLLQKNPIFLAMV